MNKKHGLGKGLNALIPEEVGVSETNDEDRKNDIEKIPINLIRSNENQPRKNFENESLMSLAKSIEEHGIIQPIVLKSDGDIYTIVAGERRWRAAKIAGLKEIPAVIVNVSDRNLLEISLIENIQREDLNPIEQAKAFERLINDFELTQEELANRIGRSRASITNCLRLLNLDDRVQEYLIEGVISEGHGRALLGLEEKEEQYQVTQKIIDEDFNVRQTEKIVKNFKNDNISSKKIENKKIAANPYHKEIENKLENIFGTKVSISNKKNKGKIQIEYYSEEDLERIVEMLNKVD